MTININIKILRGLCIKGAPHAAGTVLSMPAVEAGHVLLSGRAELADPGQLAAVNAALQTEVAAFVGRERHSAIAGTFGASYRQ